MIAPRFRVAPHVLRAFTGLEILVTGAHGPVAAATLGTLFLFFLKAGAFVFGSGLGIVPFLYGGGVGPFSWLTERTFIGWGAGRMATTGTVRNPAGIGGKWLA